MPSNYRLKQARELRGWSQAKVAELIGTDATTVSRWERGIFSPTPHFREKLCVLFEKNAEELGLLELTRSPQSSRKPSETEQQKSSPIADDIFAYILESASQDQQAYMLWEHAYVLALRGQHDEAQQLGEASLNAFEQSGHPNAAAIRAWLLQHELLSSPSTGDLAQDTPPVPKQQQDKSAKSRFPWGGVGVLFAIMLVATAVLSGLSFYQSRLSTPSVSPLSSQQYQTTSFTSLSNLSVITPTTVALTPLPSPTARSKPISSPNATQPSSVPNTTTLATLSPSQLTSRSCIPDSQTFRCTLTLQVGASSQEMFNWRASSQGLIAQINPPSGKITTGQISQIIVYINQSSTRRGSLLFTLRAPTSGETASTSATWQY